MGLFILTHLPRVPSVGPRIGDKTAHFLAYAVLAGSMYVTWAVAWPRMKGIAWYVLLLALAYGAFDEWTQPLVGRDCELYDWLADAGGAAIALIMLHGGRCLARVGTSPSQPAQAQAESV